MYRTIQTDAPLAFCTILADPAQGRPLRYYADKEAALRAARRRCAKTGESMEVAWCGYPNGNAKVWLAFIRGREVELTRYWDDSVNTPEEAYNGERRA